MNRYLFFAGIAAFMLVCNVFAQQSTSTNSNPLNNLWQNQENQQTIKNIQAGLKDINISNLQQKAKEFQDQMKPALDRLQKEAQPYLDDIQSKYFSLLKPSNSSDLSNSPSNLLAILSGKASSLYQKL